MEPIKDLILSHTLCCTTQHPKQIDYDPHLETSAPRFGMWTRNEAAMDPSQLCVTCSEQGAFFDGCLPLISPFFAPKMQEQKSLTNQTRLLSRPFSSLDLPSRRCSGAQPAQTGLPTVNPPSEYDTPTRKPNGHTHWCACCTKSSGSHRPVVQCLAARLPDPADAAGMVAPRILVLSMCALQSAHLSVSPAQADPMPCPRSASGPV